MTSLSAWLRRLASRDVASVLGIYALSRLVTIVWVLTAGVFVGAADGDGGLTSLLTVWDGQWYLRVAEHGYPDHIPVLADGTAEQSELVFFPAYPLAIRLVAAITPLGHVGAALVVAVLAGATAALAVWWLARQHLDPDAALAAAALFCFLPGAFSLSFAYAEGVFITGAALAITLARKERWVLAGLAGAVASAARPTGVAIVVPLVLLALAARGRRPFLAPVLATTGIAAFFLVVGTRVGQLDFWFRVEREAWGNHFDWGIDSTRQLLGLDPPLRGTISLNLFLITVVLAAGLLVLAAWQRLPWPELTYALVVLAPAYGTGGQGLRPRMLVAAFPLVIPLARWVRPANLPYVLVGSATLMGATAALSSVYDFTVP